MRFTETNLKGSFIIDIEEKSDRRGFFARSFCSREFSEHGLEGSIVQSNISLNHHKGTLRGMHFQRSPHEEVKIVRCTRGAIFDVMLDLRPESPTYLRWIGQELTEDNHRTLYIPKRFGHGFQTLTDNAEVMYMVTQFYAPGHAGGLPYNDPAFGIKWPLEVTSISDADASWPRYSGPIFER
ncbi:MAG TPA: dTDP-4-dehydrorhamnose 3,5-epimerase [Bacteroidetes bacterium]|jgi:dTDP-4-dehydrorhamnose 3,5-epimerase|nr:dTDP-4-dehydrorhamnose 3,5-epimerase [Bacteroidota bacterium]